MSRLDAALIGGSAFWLVVTWFVLQASRAGQLGGPTAPGTPLVFAAASLATLFFTSFVCVAKKRISVIALIVIIVIHATAIGLCYVWLNEILYVA